MGIISELELKNKFNIPQHHQQDAIADINQLLLSYKIIVFCVQPFPVLHVIPLKCCNNIVEDHSIEQMVLKKWIIYPTFYTIYLKLDTTLNTDIFTAQD